MGIVCVLESTFITGEEKDRSDKGTIRSPHCSSVYWTHRRGIKEELKY